MKCYLLLVHVLFLQGYAVPLFPDTSLPVKKLQLVNFRPQGYVDTSSGKNISL